MAVYSSSRRKMVAELGMEFRDESGLINLNSGFKDILKSKLFNK